MEGCPRGPPQEWRIKFEGGSLIGWGGGEGVFLTSLIKRQRRGKIQKVGGNFGFADDFQTSTPFL